MKKKKEIIIGLMIFLLIIILVGICVFYIINIDQKENITEVKNTSQEKKDEKLDVSDKEENKINLNDKDVITKVLDDIEKNTDFEGILKSMDGDVTAEKLSKKEFIDNKSEYVKKLQNNMKLFNIYEENGSKYVEYEVEKILNALGYSSHMGVGIKQGIQIINLSGTNDVANRGVIIAVLNDIEKNTDFGGIFKSTDGDVTAGKLSKLEYIANQKEHLAKLQNNKSLFKIYEENGSKYVEYEVEKVLNSLGYSTHMGVGIKQGIQKIKL